MPPSVGTLITQERSWRLNDLLKIPVSGFLSATQGAPPTGVKRARSAPGYISLKPTSKSKERRREPSAQHAPSNKTYIFTFDSLGSDHKSVINILEKYLQLEAKDKRNPERTSEATGCKAFVPRQHNDYDCGVYLLHFTQRFMSDPERFTHLILVSIFILRPCIGLIPYLSIVP